MFLEGTVFTVLLRRAANRIPSKDRNKRSLSYGMLKTVLHIPYHSPSRPLYRSFKVHTTFLQGPYNVPSRPLYRSFKVHTTFLQGPYKVPSRPL